MQRKKRWFQNYRKITYGTVSGVSAIIAFKSGLELVDLIQGASFEHTMQERAMAIGNAALVAGGNKIANSVAQNPEGSSDNITDTKHYMDTKIAVGFIAVGAVIPFVSEIGGMYVGGFTALHMRPTEKNMNHHSHVESV